MADSRGLKLIWLAFGIVSVAITATTAAVVANVDAGYLDILNPGYKTEFVNADAGA
jgi:hypothetical protein